MARILYISYTGMMEPLGQSQVLQYLLQLAKEHEIVVLSFEKPQHLANGSKTEALASQCANHGIVWKRLRYHKRPSILATIYDIVAGYSTAVQLARRHRTQIVHARSYIPGLIALMVKRTLGPRFLFDMRGFWPDERVDGGIWKRNSLPYRVFKRLERALLLAADTVVSLTRAGVREMEKFDYLATSRPQFEVIPTCTNLDLFKPVDEPPTDGFTLGYVGSAGSWYMFDEIAKAVGTLFRMRPDARFLVINQADHDTIRRTLTEADISLDRVEIRAVEYHEVAGQIARMNAGIFFYKPVFSKRATCPTRMGEFLSCGKPCLANDGVGDVAEDFAETGTGVTVSSFEDSTLRTALEQLIELSSQPDIGIRCRAAAEARFSLARGVEKYDRIYQKLAQSDAPANAAKPVAVQTK